MGISSSLFLFLFETRILLYSKNCRQFTPANSRLYVLSVYTYIITGYTYDYVTETNLYAISLAIPGTLINVRLLYKIKKNVPVKTYQTFSICFYSYLFLLILLVSSILLFIQYVSSSAFIMISFLKISQSSIILGYIFQFYATFLSYICFGNPPEFPETT